MNLDEELVNQAAKHETHITNELPAKMIISVTQKKNFIDRKEPLQNYSNNSFSYSSKLDFLILWILNKIYKLTQ